MVRRWRDEGRTELENLIGLFINTLVLRTDLSGEPSFPRGVRASEGPVSSTRSSIRSVPLEMLVEKLQVERSSSHTPLVQVLFNMLSFQVPSFKLSSLEIKRLPSPKTDSKFDSRLCLRLSCRPSSLNGL